MDGEIKNRKKPIFLIIVLMALAGLVFLILALAPWKKLKSADDSEFIDLTVMNSTMVYAYVNDMVNMQPDDYLGKTIKAKGKYYKTYYSLTEKYYHFVVISDATACCAQGLEFFYEGEYPSEDAEIVITGVFEKYDELGQIYYFINASSLDII